MTVSGEVRVHNDDGFVQSLPLDSRRLPGGAARWIALDEIPVERGNYHLEILLTCDDGEQWERRVDCCFIERPPPAAFSRLVVNAERTDGHRLELAARAAGVGTIRLDFNAPGFEERFVPLLDAGVRVVIATSPAHAAQFAARMGELERAQRDLIQRCELKPGDGESDWLAAAAAIRQGVSGLEVIPALADADSLSDLLADEAGLLRQAASLGGNTQELRHTARKQGSEHLTLFSGQPHPTPTDTESIAAWLQEFLSAWADGYSQVLVSEGHLVEPEALGKAYPYLAMMAHRLPDYRFMGHLPMEEGESAAVLVFRRGAGWLVAAWGEADQLLSLPLGPAERLAAFDARGNPFPPGTLADGELPVTLDAMPRFWTGHGGHLFAHVAREQALEGARALLSHSSPEELLHPEIVEMIEAFRDAPDEPVSRRHFFTLLQSLPELEGMWHSGRHPASDIVPLVAELVVFVRALCVLEEEHGEQFLEPLSDTLAQCSEYQALYVTGSTGQGTAHDRGDWLLREIDRLTSEARLLSEHGRSIEANALANLAEWRARSLGAITQSVSEAR